MIRTVDIIDEVIEFCITDRFNERGNGIASIRDIEPKTLIRLRAAILIEVADIRMSRAAVMIGMQPASLWMWIKRKMGEYKHDKELAKRRYECLQRKYNLKPDYDYLMLVPRAEPTKHDEQDTRPTKFLDMEVSAREVAAMADAMESAVAFMERYGRGQRLGELIEEANGSPVLVYYQCRSDTGRIEEALKGYRVEVYKDGGNLKRWNAGNIDVLLAHPASTAYGLNMQEGGHYIDERALKAISSKQSVQQTLLENLKDLREKYERTEEDKHIG